MIPTVAPPIHQLSICSSKRELFRRTLSPVWDNFGCWGHLIYQVKDFYFFLDPDIQILTAARGCEILDWLMKNRHLPQEFRQKVWQ